MKVINRFILVDDEEANNFYHQIVIGGLFPEANVMSFTDGKSALDYLKNEHSDYNQENPGFKSAILLDINMPEMNGWEFLDEYEGLDREQRADYVIALVTSSQNPKDVEKAKSYNLVKEYVIKPLTEENLKDLIESLKK